MRVATLLILGCMCSPPVAYSQQSPHEADSISYDLFLGEHWRTLTQYGESATAAGFDFYYLNLRTGIAFFKLGRWHIAQKWLQKAVGNYIDDTVAREYLYWIHAYLSRPTEAAKIYALLPQEAQDRIRKPPRMLLSSIAIEGGLRTTNKPDSINIFNFANLKLSHKFAPAFQLHHAYSYLNQDYFWGKYRQQNYRFAPVFNTSLGWSISVSVDLMKYERDFDYSGNTIQYNDTTSVMVNRTENMAITHAIYDSRYTGDYTLQAYHSHVTLSKTFGKAHLSLQYAYYRDQFHTPYNELVDSLVVISHYQDGESVSTSTTQGLTEQQLESSGSYYQGQIGFSTSFTFPMKKGRYAIMGIETQLVLGKDDQIHVIPFFVFQVHPRFNLSGNYLSKGKYPLGMLNGTLILNNYDRYQHRLSLTGNYLIKSHVSLFAVFQWESIEDAFLAGKYSTAGVFCGVQWTF